jgi:hypothetical protein
MGVGGQYYAPAAFTPGKDPVPIVQEAGWASEPVWTGAENLGPTGIRSPDLPARSESLYRLRRPGSKILVIISFFQFLYNVCNQFISLRNQVYTPYNSPYVISTEIGPRNT